MSLFHKAAPPPPIPEPEGPMAEFVLLTIPGEHFSRWTLKPSEPLAALIETLSTHLASLDTGEIGFVESGKVEALVYLDGPSAEQLFTDILPLLKQSPLCRGARVGIDIDVNNKQDFQPKREVTL